jgi:VIT1/CCC1 family predicted Fe2+/Mn2+ transporter
MSRLHIEKHSIHRVGWLRAAVLGANDGLVSIASLIVGVTAAAASEAEILVAGTAGLVAGAMSMAAGEYVSVSSQLDTESADLAKEKWEHINQPEYELNELAESFVARGAEKGTALEVARQLTTKDALAAHAREELGISEVNTARPLQAAMTSAATFTVGAVLPLSVVLLFPSQILIYAVTITTLIFLAILGALGAKAGGADIVKATVRVTFWGAVAMAVTAGVGTLFGAVI